MKKYPVRDELLKVMTINSLRQRVMVVHCTLCEQYNYVDFPNPNQLALLRIVGNVGHTSYNFDR